MNFINWLNENQGFVMILLTLVYVVATVIIVLYNRKTIMEMQEAREAESRPYVFAYLDKDPRDLRFYLRFKNYGKSGAKLNMVSISPILKFYHDAEPQNFLRNVILAPSQTLEFLLFEQKEETLKNDYAINLQYSSVGDSQKQYHEEYTLIIQYICQMGYTEIKKNNLSDEANALRNIARHLDSMRRKL